MKSASLTRSVALIVLSVCLAANAQAIELDLENGWIEYPFGTGTPEAFLDEGVVNLKGAISGGTTNVAFTLPVSMRPLWNVYVSVDLCGAAVGRLWIEPNGTARVQSAGAFSDAQCFTSLDGASFTRSFGGFTPLALENGWVGGSAGTSFPGATIVDGIVHLRGAMSNGTASAAFTLPAEYRPAARVFLQIGLCNAAKGRLLIEPSGIATITPFAAAAQCFTSLDGVSYDPTDSGHVSLSLLNGWVGSALSSGEPEASLVGGIVHLKGGIQNGADPDLFTLPEEMFPEATTYVPVDLCSGRKGRVVITPAGSVSVDPLLDFADAQCLTSLDGAKFVAVPERFEALTLLNDWVGAPFATRQPAVAMIDGIVHLRGAVAGGSFPDVFQLPIEMRPREPVYVAADMCGGAVGRLLIQPTGFVSVQPDNGFADAQCFTSLDGVSFVHPDTPGDVLFISFENSWDGSPFGTSWPVFNVIDGIVHMRGAVSGGTASHIVTLPAALRPAHNAYTTTNLFGASKGRVLVRPNGEVNVFPLSSDAQAFTSLDGVRYDTATVGDTLLTLENGWTGGPFATGTPSATRIKGMVYLKGAMEDGVSSVAFTLPPRLRPDARIYLPVDLCSGAKGRLVIESTGSTRVVSEGDFADAQCFTSLDGAVYSVPEPGAGALLVAGLLLLGKLAGSTRSRAVD